MDERQKLLVTIASIAAVAVGLLYLDYREYTALAETRNTIENTRAAIKAAEAKIAEIPTLEAERARLTEVVEENVRILPDEKEVESLLETLSELKDQSGLTPDAIESFQFAQESASARGRSTASANFQKYICQVRLRATLFQFATFVNLLERYKRFVQVDSFSMKPEATGAELDVNMQMSTFTYTRGAKGGAAKAAAGKAGKK
jgi:Tfp pilus assembly protein PilO